MGTKIYPNKYMETMMAQWLKHLHWYHSGSGLESRCSLKFFILEFRACLNWVENCEDLYFYKSKKILDNTEKCSSRSVRLPLTLSEQFRFVNLLGSVLAGVMEREGLWKRKGTVRGTKRGKMFTCGWHKGRRQRGWVVRASDLVSFPVLAISWSCSC